ncbi:MULTISPECIES: hypothetical protein [Streptomyces]|uniref:SMI1/KNR4 family protein n=1 Tax=Streptomyces evansiae TaxID=3075535 RepID=A0ABU2QXK0_9ACTN|nr:MULTISPECIES: hypothetical protein [unclassified Streptomyces]MDT0409172.1 hypothetical protein [Streptomyces sp. DSM 41979]MYQ58549.1 hypothetical protein [Streptomyces sp. SID4926]SCD79947.1 hypothetical protein GA0115252_11932 [Streptomyces sp. DfronAA-171]
MFLMRPVVEIQAVDGRPPWPVAALRPYGFLALRGGLSEEETGAVVLGLAQGNDHDGDPDLPPRPAGRLPALLHGLLSYEFPTAAGGLRVTDTRTGADFPPGCCCGLEDWREWYDVLDGGPPLWWGHAARPGEDPRAERDGDVVRLRATGGAASAVPVAEVRRLLDGVEDALRDFLADAAGWAVRTVPAHAEALAPALARALAVG